MIKNLKSYFLFSKKIYNFLLPALPYVLFSGIILLFVAYCISAFRVSLNPDAVYYLGVIEQISNGKVPYRDFGLGYTPLGFYMMLIPKYIFGEHCNYTVYISFLYIISFLNAFILFKLAKRYTGNNNLSLFAAFLFLLQIYNLQGVYFILEPFVVFWGLLALYLTTAKVLNLKMIFFSGLFAGFSFLSKQYGLGSLAVVMFFFIVNSKSIKLLIKNEILVFTGFSFGIGLFFFIGYISGVRFEDFYYVSTGGHYGVRSLFYYWESIELLVLKLAPWLLFLPVYYYYYYYYKIKSNNSFLHIFVLLVAVIIFSFQFYFLNLVHYYILLIPYTVLISVILLHIKIPRSIRYIYLILLIFPMISNIHHVFKNTKSLLGQNERDKQIHQSAEIANLIGDTQNKIVYCFSGIINYVYFFNNYQPPLIQKYGYSFGYETNDGIKERLMKSDFLIIDQANYSLMLKTKSKGNIVKYLNVEFISEKTSTGIYVFSRK